MDFCEKTERGKSQKPCDTLVQAINAGLFEQNVYTKRSENLSRVAVATRKFKGKYALVSYCPFCGVNIDTQDYGIKS